MEEKIAEVVRQHGWYAASISDHQPPFLYTIGLMQTLNHPELIMFGLEENNAHALFSQLVRDIRAGRSYAEPGMYTVSIGDDEQRVGVRRVHPTQHELYLGFALGYSRYIGRWASWKRCRFSGPPATASSPSKSAAIWRFISSNRGSTSA